MEKEEIIDDEMLPATSSALIIHQDMTMNMYLAKQEDSENIADNSWLIFGIGQLLTDKEYTQRLSDLVGERIEQLQKAVKDNQDEDLEVE